MTPRRGVLAGAPPARRAVAVVAHPDDESFGLGAVLSALAGDGTAVAVVCLTHGEASTLGAGSDLGERRRAELRAAADALGVGDVTLFDFPDGGLDLVDPATLDAILARQVAGADLVVVFEPGGVTGHPDHRAATAAAERVAARLGVAVLRWGVAPAVAIALREELGVDFVPFHHGEDVEVDRTRQRAAVSCHASQTSGNAVLGRRLAIQGDCERVHYQPAPTARRHPPCCAGVDVSPVG